jgi:hypothetical protein
MSEIRTSRGLRSILVLELRHDPRKDCTIVLDSYVAYESNHEIDGWPLSIQHSPY